MNRILKRDLFIEFWLETQIEIAKWMRSERQRGECVYDELVRGRERNRWANKLQRFKYFFSSSFTFRWNPINENTMRVDWVEIQMCCVTLCEIWKHIDVLLRIMFYPAITCYRINIDTIHSIWLLHYIVLHTLVCATAVVCIQHTCGKHNKMESLHFMFTNTALCWQIPYTQIRYWQICNKCDGFKMAAGDVLPRCLFQIKFHRFRSHNNTHC